MQSRYRVAQRWALWPAALIGAVGLGQLAGRGASRITLLALAAGCSTILVLVIRDQLRPGLMAWIPLGTLAFPWVRIPKGQPVLTFDRAWIGALVLAAFLSRRPNASTARSRPLALALGCLVLAFAFRIALTVAAIGDQFSARTIWIDAILLPAGLFFVARRVVSDASTWHRLAGAFALAGAILALFGIGQHFWGFELASLSGGQLRYDTAVDLVRISGPYSTPEVFALNLTICLAATLSWAQGRGGAVCLLGGVAAALEVVAIGLTLFRAAWIACVIVIVAAAASRRSRSARTVGIVTIGAALLLGLHLFGDTGMLSERLGESSNVYGRFATYQQGWAIFRDAPLVGVGVNQFAIGQELVLDVAVHGTRAVENAHSTFVSILAEQGAVGFLALLAVVFWTWRLLHDLRRRSTTREEFLALGALRGGTLAYLVMSLTLTMWPYGSSNAFFLVLIGAAAGLADAGTGYEPAQ